MPAEYKLLTLTLEPTGEKEKYVSELLHWTDYFSLIYAALISSYL